MTWPAPMDLALFMGVVLLLALYGLTVSGHFPREFRAATLDTGTGRAILWGSLAVSLAVAAVALAFAWVRLPVAAAIIGGGAMVLIAPMLLQPLPDWFVNGRQGLVTFSGLALILALLAGRLYM